MTIAAAAMTTATAITTTDKNQKKAMPLRAALAARSFVLSGGSFASLKVSRGGYHVKSNIVYSLCKNIVYTFCKRNSLGSSLIR